MTLPGKPAWLPALLWRNALRHASRHPAQTFLSLLGIALGVMMVVAVDLANHSARRAFALSVEAVRGTVTHSIVGSTQGVPESVFASLRTGTGLRRSAPVVEGELRLGGRRLTLLGLDPVSEAALQRRLPGLELDTLGLVGLASAALMAPGAIFLPEGLAAELRLVQGSSIALDPPEGPQLTLVATLPEQEAGTRLAIMDIAAAQEVLGRQGWLDRIDLVLEEAEVARLEAWLPADLRLVEAGSGQASLEQMTEAFHVNLLAMSLLALLVAALLIYNTVTLSVLERRGEFGVLRAQGVTRAQLLVLVLGEAALLGLLASAIGVLLGIWLGSQLVDLVTRTIEDLYFTLAVRAYRIAPLLLLKALAWGLGVTLFSAFLPALQAARSQPATLQQRGQGEQALRGQLRALAPVGLLLLLAAWLLLRGDGDLLRGFVALFMAVAGYCLLVPLVLQGALLVLQHVLPSGSLTWYLALRAVRSGLDRCALAVAALAVAVSVTIGVGIMVASLRDSVLLWLDQSLPGDVQVVSRDADGLPPGLEQRLFTVEGIAALQQAWQFEAESSVGRLRLVAGSGAPEDWLYFQSGELPDQDAIAISEPMAFLFSLQEGDVLDLYTPAGRHPLRISGIFHDYSTGTPVAALSGPQVAALWPGLAPSRLSLRLLDSQDPEELAARLRELPEFREARLAATPNRAIREQTLRIFERTFAITDVLRLLAIGVAFVGVLGAMLALQLQQARDHAVLRACGMTGRELARLILWQTLLLGACAGLLALPLGLLTSEVLIDVINRRSFGWSMQHSLPGGVLLQALLLAIVAAVLAGVAPARRLTRLQPAEALRGDT